MDAAELAAKRGAGTLFHVMLRRPGTSPTEAADGIATAVALTPLGERWQELSREIAEQRLIAWLERDLAYNAVLLATADARAIAERFFAAVGQALYLSNGWTEVAAVNERSTAQSWTPVSDATFDAGIIAVGETQVAILWVRDED